jgi:bacteriocin-like protein
MNHSSKHVERELTDQAREVADQRHEMTSDELEQVSGGLLLSNLLRMMADLQKSAVGNIR